VEVTMRSSYGCAVSLARGKSLILVMQFR